MIERRTDLRVFFPWEHHRGIRGLLSRRRARAVALIVSAMALVAFFYRTSARASSVRATRATIATVARGVEAFRADHAGACPKALGELVALGYLRTEPVDAWGRPLRFDCPGRHDVLGFDVTSGGPDADDVTQESTGLGEVR
jgi:hypothetical protein